MHERDEKTIRTKGGPESFKLHTIRMDAGRARRLLRLHASFGALVASFMGMTWMIWLLVFQLRVQPLLDNACSARLSSVLAEKKCVMASAVAQIQAQLAAGQFQRPSGLREFVFGGIKMPEKPDPDWLQPSADGKCHNPLTGEKMAGTIALRGACWSVMGKYTPDEPCPDWLYNPPPEVGPEPKFESLRSSCFRPIPSPKPQAANQGTP